MKLIIFAITLNLISLCLSFHRFHEEQFTVFNPTYYESMLQKHQIETEILNAFYKCNQTYLVPFHASLELFQNPPFGIMRMTEENAKCLMDCTMREMGVMTDKGFDKKEYMTQIKKLNYNYTHYDLDKMTLDEKHEIMTTLDGLAPRAHIYKNIKIYEFAVNECKGVTDSINDNCQNSYKVARCIINRCREEGANNPFYPILRRCDEANEAFCNTGEVEIFSE